MSTQLSQRDADGPIEILLVEDNPGDVRLTEEAFTAATSETVLRSVSSGEAALDCLRQRVADESASLPRLALVDLDLPRKDGCEVLRAIRDDPRLEALPVLVLTGSDASEDIERCYDARANAYLTKPRDPDEFRSLVRSVEEFWFERAQLPPISQ